MTDSIKQSRNEWLKKATNSSLWAAYGDALGYISELADSKKLIYRIGNSEVQNLSRWKRKIGGKYGVTLSLPKGCYSDDTQLRLCTSRAIGNDGRFDADAFANIELPVWMSYQLGGGISTNAAAKSLTKKSIGWATNFFSTNRSKYINGGGNGAAMRIQPHVWSHPKTETSRTLIRNIIHNTIPTHGHPKAILGAIFHGYCLYYAMAEGEAPNERNWKTFLQDFKKVPEIITEDQTLGITWLPLWESLNETSFSTVWQEELDNFSADINTLSPLLGDTGYRAYYQAIDSIGCLQQKWRGTATKTALIASALVLIAESNPTLCAQFSANTLDSDTDTIGTMATAISGALADTPPPEAVIDCEYIKSEAARLSDIRFGLSPNVFIYPEIEKWTAPKSNADTVFQDNDKLYITGIGEITPLSEKYYDSKQTFCWQWVKTSFGQTLLVKRRDQPNKGLPQTGRYKQSSKPSIPSQHIINNEESEAKNNYSPVNNLSEKALKNNLSAQSIGSAIIHAAKGEYGVDRAIAVAAIIARELLKKDDKN